MRSKEELVQEIAKREKKIAELEEALAGYYAAFDDRVAEKKATIDELNAKKDAVVAKKLPPIFPVAIIAAIIGAIVSNSMKIGWLTGILTAVAVVLVIGAIVISNKNKSVYNEEVKPFLDGIERSEKAIKALYASDDRIAKTKEKISKEQKNLALWQTRLKDCDMVQRIGAHNLIVRKAVSDKDVILVVDGKDKGYLKDGMNFFYLDPGKHSMYVIIFSASDKYETEDLLFTVDENNEYVTLRVKYENRKVIFYLTGYDSFEDYAEGVSDKQGFADEIAKAAKNVNG